MGQNSVYCCAPAPSYVYDDHCLTAASGGYFVEIDVNNPPQKNYRPSLRQSARGLELPVSDMILANNQNLDTYTRVDNPSVLSSTELLPVSNPPRPVGSTV